MNLKHFKLERYFARHEFSAKYMLSSSDCDGYSLADILSQASSEERDIWDNMSFGYTETKGDIALRKSILQYYKTDDPDKVIVASPGELNFIAMNVLLRPDDHVICVSPSYQSLYQIVKSLGAELSFWEPDGDTWEFDSADLKALIKENTRLIITNFPHNPTGSYLTRDQLDEVIYIAAEHDIYIFSDEMYHKLMVSEYEELPPISDLYDKGISLWGTSKTIGLAGLRLGWLVSQDQTVIDQVEAFKDYLSICNSRPSEVLTMIALNRIDAFIEPNIAKIKRNIEHFTTFAKAHPIISSFVPPKAGSTAYVGLDINTTAKEFSDQLVAETGIMTVPSEMFEDDRKYIRVGFGRKNFPMVLEELSQYLEDQGR